MNSKYLGALIILADIFSVASTVTHINLFAILSLLLVVYALLKCTPEQSFSLVVATCLFAKTYSIAGRATYFLVMALSLYKLYQNKLKTSSVLALPFFIFIVIYLIHDFSSGSGITTVYMAINIIYFYAVFSKLDVKHYNHQFTVYLFCISIIINIIGAILLTPDLTRLSDETTLNMRLGEGDSANGGSNDLGGAMGFPILTMLLLSFTLPILLGQSRIFRKFSILLLDLSVVAITFFTTSKVYLLGLSVFLICLLAHFMRGKLSIIQLTLIVGGLISVVVFLTNTGYLDLIFERYLFRIGDDYSDVDRLSSGRAIIYESCINYLSDHPLAILFGNGYYGYIELGARTRQFFSMSAHNIFLDCIMAYGIYGMFLFVMQGQMLCARIRKTLNLKASLLGAIPLICWVAMSLTNSPFMLSKTYVYMPFLALHIYYSKDLMKR